MYVSNFCTLTNFEGLRRSLINVAVIWHNWVEATYTFVLEELSKLVLDPVGVSIAFPVVRHVVNAGQHISHQRLGTEHQVLKRRVTFTITVLVVIRLSMYCLAMAVRLTMKCIPSSSENTPKGCENQKYNGLSHCYVASLLSTFPCNETTKVWCVVSH